MATSTLLRKKIGLMAAIIGSLLMLSVLGLVLCRLGNLINPQGEASSSCIIEKIGPTANQAGVSVYGHITYCDDLIHQSTVYLYLSRSYPVEDKVDLVVRYEFDPRNPPPHVEWVSSSAVNISIGDIIQLTKLEKVHLGVSLDIGLRREERPQSEWDATVLRLEIGLVIVVIIMVVLGALMFLLIRRLLTLFQVPKAIPR